MLLAVLRFSPAKKKPQPVSINLTWYRSYPGESWGMVRKGLLWSFSYMGAMLPKQAFDSATVFKDSTTFELRLDKLGFNKTALRALSQLCDSIKNSEDYSTNTSIDLARFLVLTLYSPYHYYKITGVEPDLNSFVKKYKLEKPHYFGVTKSSVSKAHRLIKFTNDTTLLRVGFIAEEGHGSLHEKTFNAEVFEAFDLMPNGQLRYAIYDKNGRLTDASSDVFSTAGKIGKCMWCHETYIQPLFVTNTPVTGMLLNDQFEKKVFQLQAVLDRYRKNLDTEIDFTNKSDHTSGELLYIGFMEPSLYRLSQELKKDTSELRRSVIEPTHVYEEFPFFGNLYHRIYTDRYFSYTKLRVPEYVREKSSYEPDYFK